MAPTLSKLGVMAWWAGHLEDIIKTECINRFDASSMCRGKCVLADELSKWDESTSNANEVITGIILHQSEIYIISKYQSITNQTKITEINLDDNFNYLLRSDIVIKNPKLRPPILS